MQIIIKAVEKEKEQKIFSQWVAQLPLMAMSGEYTSFEDYRDRITGANIDKRSTEEILAELDELEKGMEIDGE